MNFVSRELVEKWARLYFVFCLEALASRPLLYAFEACNIANSTNDLLCGGHISTFHISKMRSIQYYVLCLCPLGLVRCGGHNMSFLPGFTCSAISYLFSSSDELFSVIDQVEQYRWLINFFTLLGSSTPTARHVNLPPGYPHGGSLASEAHVVSNSDVPVTPSAAISMSSAVNGINAYPGGLPPSITLHNMAVPSSPSFLNGATCKLESFTTSS